MFFVVEKFLKLEKRRMLGFVRNSLDTYLRGRIWYPIESSNETFGFPYSILGTLKITDFHIFFQKKKLWMTVWGG